MKVQQMTNDRGRAIPNQFVIDSEDGRRFQSYKSIIALRKNDGSVVLDRNYWNYSATTGKYRNYFLNEGIKETRQKIKSGVYILDDLNR